MSLALKAGTHGEPHVVDARRSAELRSIRLPMRQRIGYGAGGLVDGTVIGTLNLFLLYYVTVVCGLSGSLAGLAIASGLVVDAVADFLIGAWSDGTRTRFGRRLPFMLPALPIAAISLIALFSVPQGLGATALFVWVACLSTLLRVSTSLFFLPHTALGAELSDDYADRSAIMAIRWLFNMLAGVIAMVIGFGLYFEGGSGLLNRNSYIPFAATISLVLVIGGLIAARTAWNTRAREHSTSTHSKGTRITVQAKEMAASRSFRTLFIGSLLFFIGWGVSSSLMLHAYTYFWALAGQQIQLVTTGLMVGLLLGGFVGGRLLASFEKRTVMVCGIIAMLVLLAGPPTLRLAGLFPLSGGTLVALLTTGTVFSGMSAACAAIALASALADAVDEHELLFGGRREGLYFAGWAFATKAAAGLGTLVAGLSLQIIGFPAHLETNPGVPLQLADRTVALLGAVAGPGAALLSATGLLVLLRYGIDKSRHQSIIAALAERKTVEGQ
jgi:glycoside/pentoside/hexuronide:cation symporter, GPH family